jgi:hypothetical protein
VNISLDEAIVIYAKASRAWFGSNAVKKTQEKIDLLRSKGDLEGSRVFERVRGALERLERPLPTERAA